MADLAPPTARVVVRRIGRHARRVIAGGFELRICARFERSLYVGSDDGRLACVGGAGLGDGPLNILVGEDDFRADRFRDREPLAFDAAAAAIWQPPAVPCPERGRLQQGLVALERALSTVAPRGLAAPANADDPAAVRAQAGLTALSAWLDADRGGGKVPPPVVDILGLGPGLTPAGDDALGGAMIALRAFGRTAPADELAGQLLPLAAGRTSTISLAHLRAAADGEGAAPLHAALAALAGADVAALGDALRRLDRIGHSSGWDALAGALAAVRAST